MKRFDVVVGEDFDIDRFQVKSIEELDKISEIAERRFNRQFKSKLSLGILCGIALALAGATAIGLYDGTLNEVGSVWSAAALPLGLILRGYFEKPVPT